RERLGGRRWVGLFVGLCGVAAIVGLDLSHVNVVALVEIALVAVCYAVGPIILSRYLAGLPPLGVVAASLALSALGYAPLAALRARPRRQRAGHGRRPASARRAIKWLPSGPMPRAILLAALALLVLGPASAGSALQPTAAGMPVWSPDSRSLAFTGVVEPGERADVFVANVATGATVDVTADAPGELHGRSAWSRDGRTIAYETNLSTPVETKVTVSLGGADGAGRRDLTSTGATGNVCFTAPDRTLVFDD